MYDVDFQSKNITGKASKRIFNCGGVCSVLSVTHKHFAVLPLQKQYYIQKV